MKFNVNLPNIGKNLPKHKNAILPWLGKLVLTLFGWKFENDIPNIRKLVLIVGPHTSNWDFVFGLAGLLSTGIKVSWLGKHSIFKKPFRKALLWVGGLPVERSAASGVVDTIIQRFNTSKQFILALAPEGTRSQVDRWKTGFYYIAQGAGVPVFIVCIDYKDKVLRMGPVIYPTGDMEADLKKMQAPFSEVQARKKNNILKSR